MGLLFFPEFIRTLIFFFNGLFLMQGLFFPRNPILSKKRKKKTQKTKKPLQKLKKKKRQQRVVFIWCLLFKFFKLRKSWWHIYTFLCKNKWMAIDFKKILLCTSVWKSLYNISLKYALFYLWVFYWINLKCTSPGFATEWELILFFFYF